MECSGSGADTRPPENIRSTLKPSQNADRTSAEQPPHHELHQARRTARPAAVSAAWHAARQCSAQCSPRWLSQRRCQRPSRKGECFATCMYHGLTAPPPAQSQAGIACVSRSGVGPQRAPSHRQSSMAAAATHRCFQLSAVFSAILHSRSSSPAGGQSLGHSSGGRCMSTRCSFVQCHAAACSIPRCPVRHRDYGRPVAVLHDPGTRKSRSYNCLRGGCQVTRGTILRCCGLEPTAVDWPSPASDLVFDLRLCSNYTS